MVGWVVFSLLWEHCGSKPFLGGCLHGKSPPPGNRTRDHECAHCDPGYYFDFPYCKAHAGFCKHGKLAEQKLRVVEDQCGSCDPGYYLDVYQCLEYKGSCKHGALLALKNRTDDNQCGSCDAGYYLQGHRCEPFGGSCENGRLIQVQADRVRDNQCESCNAGFHYQYPGVCVAFKGKCEHGELIAVSERKRDGQCGICDPGYALFGHECRGYAGSCVHGELIAQKDRQEENHCGKCKHGYYLVEHRCEPYAGVCAHGDLIPELKNRTGEDQCGSCDAGYGLRNKTCTGCNQLENIYEEGVWNAKLQVPRDLVGCTETAIFNLTKSKHFRNRRDFAAVLKKLNANFHGMMNGKTPVLTLAEHCYDSKQESDWTEIRRLMWVMVREHADLKTGDPGHVAKKNGCPGIAKIIHEHSIPDQYFKRWDYYANRKTTVFIFLYEWFNFYRSTSVLAALVLGVIFGLVPLLTPGSRSKAPGIPQATPGTNSSFGLEQDGPLPTPLTSNILEPEQQVLVPQEKEPGEGAIQLATLGCLPFGEERLQYIMCVLAVVASIVFPIHVCMSTIIPMVFLPLFCITLVLPSLFDPKAHCGRNLAFRVFFPFESPSFTGQAVAMGLAIGRPVLLYMLSLLAASSDVVWAIHHRAELVPLWMKPWYWFRASAARKMQHLLPLQSATHYIQSEIILNPFYLAEYDDLFGLQWIPIPTRKLCCCLEPVLGYMTVLWCVLSTWLWFKRGKGSPDTQEQPPDVAVMAIRVQMHSDGGRKLELSKIEGVQGALGYVEEICLRLEKKVAWWHSSASDFIIRVTENAEYRFVRNLRPRSKKVVQFNFVVYCIHRFLDAIQIHNLYWNGSNAVGATMLCWFTWALVWRISKEDFCMLKAEMETLEIRGVKTDQYIKRWNNGAESRVSLMFTAYAIHFSVTTADNLLFSIVNMCVAVFDFYHILFFKGYLRVKYTALQEALRP